MSKQPLKILAVAAGHDRICCVFAIGKQPMDWQMSYKATKTQEQARAKVTEWIAYYRPDIFLTPIALDSSRKGPRTKNLVTVARQIAEMSPAQSIEMQSSQPFENKYELIKHLCEKYPQMKVISVKSRKYWEKENPRVSYFEAAGMIDDLNGK